jgi:hypothetical protein
VYGIDARDIWVFDGQDFNGLGNQRVKNWFFEQLDPDHVDRVFMQTNTQKNQIEIYYPTTEAVAGVPNKMISYRYDLDVWNPPRDVNSATFATESPIWTASPDVEYTNVPTVAVTGVGTGFRVDITEQGSRYKSYATRGDIKAAGSGYVVGNTVKVLGTNIGGATPANDCTMTITAVNGTGGVTAYTVPLGLAAGQWTYNPGSRTVVYVRADDTVRLVMKDTGFNFIDDVNGIADPIVSVFRRDNIKMLPDYSGKLMVHRILPEINNLDANDLPINPTTQPELIGSVDITIEGANSVGQAPQASVGVTVATDTDNPWAQINQNAFRVNSIELSNSSKTNAWICPAITWQYTQVEDDR